MTMADINPSAENVRAMLTGALDRLRKANAEYFELLERGLSASPLPMADQAKQFCNFMQRNVTATFDLGDKLIQAKDMQDALKTQSEFFQEQMRALTDQAKNVGESAMKAASGMFGQKN
jgi:phasin